LGDLTIQGKSTRTQYSLALALHRLFATLGEKMTEEQFISEEDLEIVDSIYSDLLDVEDISNLAELEKIVFLVESYNMEINSGLDFIQWYRWSEPAQLKETPAALKTIGLTNSYEICMEALKITFPNGLPETADDKDGAIDSLEDDDEKENIRDRLVGLAEKQEDQNYNLTTGLAAWIRNNTK